MLKEKVIPSGFKIPSTEVEKFQVTNALFLRAKGAPKCDICASIVDKHVVIPEENLAVSGSFLIDRASHLPVLFCVDCLGLGRQGTPSGKPFLDWLSPGDIVVPLSVLEGLCSN